MSKAKNVSKLGSKRLGYRLNEMELDEIRNLAMLATEIGTSEAVTEEQADMLEYLSASTIVLSRRSLKHISDREHMLFIGCEPLPDSPHDA